jgi:uncharacterized protein (TIGR00255 family)
MIKSMTGYGKGQATAGDISLSVEIKSVNHRYGDISVKAPRFLLGHEAAIKKRVGERLKRGKIDVFINIENNTCAGRVPVLNQDLAAAYMVLFRRMRAEFDLDGDITVDLLAGQKEVISLAEGEPDEQALADALGEALTTALAAMEQMRQSEGTATRHDMEEHLAHIETLLGTARERAPLVPAEWKEKLMERLARLENGFEIDPQRVAQEVAVFADRCDISEELARFASHIEQFRGLFSVEEAVGRQMDFILQEMNREANTMGSKSNDLELTRLVVSMKADLEKIREQVQNIE